jgi:hypothetical protein
LPTPRPLKKLFSDIESCDNGAVTLDIDLHQILEQISSASDHLEQTATAVIVVVVSLKMLVESVDPAGEDRNLYFGRAGVTLAGGVLGDYRLLFFFGHFFHLYKFFRAPTQISVGEVLVEPLSETRDGVTQNYYITTKIKSKYFFGLFCELFEKLCKKFGVATYNGATPKEFILFLLL